MLLQYLRQVFCFDGLGYCVNWNLERLCCLKQVYLRRILKEVVTVKALFFLNSFAGGGAERVCLNLAKELYRLNIESDFVTVYAGKTDYDVPRYIRVYCIGAREGVHALGILWKIIRSVSGVNTFIDGQEYLLITAHLPMSQILASLTNKKNKCLYVMHVTQHLDKRSHFWYYRICLQNFLKKKQIVTVSNGLKAELSNEYKINTESITTIYNPCDILSLRHKKRQAFSYTRPYILVVGRLEEQKDPLHALELYYRGSFYKDYDLVYLGKGSLEDTLRKRIVDYNLQTNIFLAGFQNNSEQWIANASLLLSCSKQEGLPMNMIEALACGTPVAAFDCPYGPNEILVDELAEYLIDPRGDLEESIKVISSALSSYPSITEKYYSKFDGRSIIRLYIDVWQKYFQIM